MKYVDFKPLVKYVLSGGVAFVADITILYLLVELIGIHYLLATTIAFIVSLSINYVISRFFIFTKTKFSNRRSYFNFVGISLFGLAIINTLMYLMVDILNIHYLVSRILIAGTVGVASFFIHKHITFKVTEWEKDRAILSRTKKTLLHVYFSFRTWVPYWFYILNRKPRKLYSQHKRNINNLQKRIIESLNSEGIAVTSLSELFPNENLLEKLQNYESKIEPIQEESQRKKGYWIDYWDINGKFDFNNPFAKLSVDERVLDIVNGYMKMATKLKYYTLTKTKVVSGGAVNSQRWHRDPQEKRMCKMFIYLTDVNQGSGAFIYIGKSVHGLKWGHLFPQETPMGVYPEDGEVEKVIPDSEAKLYSGKAGTVIFCDTSGIHKGGYATESERLLSVFHYTAPSYKEPKFFALGSEYKSFRKKFSKIQRYSLED